MSRVRAGQVSRALRERAVALAKRLTTLDAVRDDQMLATQLECSRAIEDAVPLLAEARRRGWMDGGFWALPASHPLRTVGLQVLESLLADRAETARAGRATAAAKGAKTAASELRRRDERVKALLRQMDRDEDGRRRSQRELVNLLRERGVPVGRDKVARLRPK